MDSVPAGPACPTLPLTVVLLVISEVSLRLADPAPRVLPSPSVQVPMDPVAPMVLLHIAVLRVLTGLISFWDQVIPGLTTLDHQVLGSVPHHMDLWDPTDLCMALHLTSWTGVPCRCSNRTTRYSR